MNPATCRPPMPTPEHGSRTTVSNDERILLLTTPSGQGHIPGRPSCRNDRRDWARSSFARSHDQVRTDTRLQPPPHRRVDVTDRARRHRVRSGHDPRPPNVQKCITLEGITLGRNVAGIVVSAIAAIAARSVALAGSGLDSLIAIGASTVVIWEALALTILTITAY